jgi:hypothetical protein
VAAGQLGEARWPVALPDGRHFLFYASGGVPERAGTYVASLDPEPPALLLPAVRAAFAPPDHLVFVRDGTLVAQRFDADARRLEGTPVTIPGEMRAGTRISAGGSTLTMTESSSAERLVWLDRRGNQLDAVDVPRSVQRFWLSPDDRYALAVIDQAQVRELWLIDLVRKVSTRIRDNATTPAWAPDSSRFLFTAIGATGTDFYLRTLAGPPDEALWLKTNDVKIVSSWSPDGQFVVFTRFTDPEQTAQDLWLLPTSGTHTPVPFIQTKARENGGQVSPDGRWIAYASDETGAYEVYAQAFPASGAKVRISLNGGTQPIWRRNGRELFYLSADKQVMVTPLDGGQTLNPGPSTRLFPSAAGGMSTLDFAPAANGERFLILSRRSEGRMSILMNWQAAQRP